MSGPNDLLAQPAITHLSACRRLGELGVESMSSDRDVDISTVDMAGWDTGAICAADPPLLLGQEKTVRLTGKKGAGGASGDVGGAWRA